MSSRTPLQERALAGVFAALTLLCATLIAPARAAAAPPAPDWDGIFDVKR